MKIREVFAGTAGQPLSQFVELQMYAANQTVLSGKQLVVYDAAGTAIQTFTFPSNVANGANLSSVLIATTQAASFFGITPDFTMTPVLPAAGGKVCFQRPTPLTVWDCMSWGSYSGSSVGTGAPFNPAGGLVSGKSALRDISGGANPTQLEAADDTNDSAADFDLANPGPRNNAGQTTSTAGVVVVTGGTLRFTANAGSVVNSVTLSGPSAGFYTVRDTRSPLTLGAGCQRLTVNEVRCTSAGVFQSSLDSGLSSDIMTVSTTIPTTLTAGAGNDKITGGSGADSLVGGDGNDTLRGGPSDDALSGGPGADVLGGLGGVDTVSYVGRTAGVLADIDGVADDGSSSDGPAGARDNVATDVENLVGGNGPDTLTGSAGINRLTGGLGADRLRGREGNDTLIAKDGVVDTEINCDGGVSAGLADVASVDAADPATIGCETVTT